MSPLTRLFVVLLVVLSLLLSAATVVFVNQVQNFKATADAAQQQLTAERSKSEAMRNDAEAARAVAQESVRQSANQLEQARQQINTIQQQMIERDTQLGQAKSQAAIQAADLTRLAEALKASEDTKGQLQQQVADLRGGNDKLLSQNAELNQTVTDLTNRLEVTERERKFVSEQLTEARGSAGGQSMGGPGANGSPQMASAHGPAPAINGVIRAVRPISGLPYATISVGSADNVARGMEFKVVSSDNGDFLGVLTVDSVELNEATGRLSGPRLGEIRPGSPARTQLQ